MPSLRRGQCRCRKWAGRDMAETIAIASDHAGFELKEALKSTLSELDFKPLDLGTDGEKMAEWLRANGAATVIGDLKWDAKGDLSKSTYAWYLWHDGNYDQEPTN